MAYEAYYQHYERRGFAFDRGLLTTYALSLQTKPFVILSGISGTGKTKIAQFFNVPATAALPAMKAATPAPPPTGKWIIMTVRGGLGAGGDGRANFQYEDLGALLTDKDIADIKPRMEQLRASGNEDNICEPFELMIETPDGIKLRAKAYLQRASSPLLRIRFKSKRGDADAYDSTGYFIKNYPQGTVLKLEKVGEKHLKIVSVNDKDVAAKAVELDVSERAHIKNTCFVSVRSDWTDPTPLFGYYNLIDQKYHLTPALTFILTARENPELPFFLILDEMNLAKVEHYFSDFLSCLESRHIEGGALIQEPIHLHSDSGLVNTNNEYFDVIGPQLELPPNLFVTGTINVDESTYMFSPKVLDRANVIELNTVDLATYGAGGGGVKSSYQLASFPNLLTFHLPQSSDFVSLPPPARSFIEGVHAILTRHQLQFGYRVVNEVSRYLLNAASHCEASPQLLASSLDCQMVQKILTKMNGSQGKLDVVIRELLSFLVDGKAEYPMELEAVSKIVPESTSYPLAVRKLQRMSAALTLNGFANFIE